MSGLQTGQFSSWFIGSAVFAAFKEIAIFVEYLNELVSFYNSNAMENPFINNDESLSNLKKKKS